MFTRVIYQPFLKLLLAIYQGLDLISGGNADMGMVLIILAILFRILLLPLSIASQFTQTEREKIEKKLAEINKVFTEDSPRKKEEIKKLFKQNRRIWISEAINLTLHILIVLLLNRVFTQGLFSADFNLTPSVSTEASNAFKLVFLEKYDLTKPSKSLNLLLSLVIFIVESISMFTAPFPVTTKDIFRLQIFLPLLSYIIFSRFPAGVTLFVISALSFSVILILLQLIRQLFKKINRNPVPAVAKNKKM